MKKHLSHCKQRARSLKKTRPDLPHMKRLDEAAQSQGFQHYTHLIRLHKLLGPDTEPSRINITLAGGDSTQSPYRKVDVSFRVS